MNRLFEETVFLLMDRGWQEIVPIFILAALRPLGVFYSFTGFTWAMGSTRILRTVLAIVAGLPMVFLNIDVLGTLLDAKSIFVLGFIAVTEIGIGFAIGFIASLPFFALSFAGTMCDQFRGETDSGIQTPLGGTISSFGLLYTIIGLFAFAYADGISVLVHIIYQSYEVWPLLEPLPELTYNSVAITLSIFGANTLMGIKIVIPLLLLLFVIEISTIAAARIAKRFNFYNFAFPLKNLAAMVTLPIAGTYVWLFLMTHMPEIFRQFNLIQQVRP